MFKIAIVGGGLSGTLLAMNILQSKTSRDVSIKLIDNKNAEELGPAFSTDEDFLLNVRAGMMGAVHNDPEHFWRWLQENGIKAEKTDFIQRKIYRKYVKELFNEALKNKNSNITFERIHGEAVDIIQHGITAEILLENGKSINADKAVLALGNFPPRNPGLKNMEFLNSPLYLQNPWKLDLFSALEADQAVFIIGTGQTTVDIAAGLHRHGHKGKIYAISRRGLLPMVHKLTKPYPQFYDELKNLKTIYELFKAVRMHIRKAEKSGYSSMAVIDSLRPYTQDLWINLKPEEKLIFMRHLFRYWEIIRSRIPEESGEIINQMRLSGQLNIIPGRIIEIADRKNSIDISYKPRYSEGQLSINAGIAINCIGPEVDYGKIENTLVKNIINRGLIQPDPLKLGINASVDGRIVNKDGTLSDMFYTIGMPLRGILWETLAAPEIRSQAYFLSKMLLNGD